MFLVFVCGRDGLPKRKGTGGMLELFSSFFLRTATTTFQDGANGDNDRCSLPHKALA